MMVITICSIPWVMGELSVPHNTIIDLNNIMIYAIASVKFRSKLNCGYQIRDSCMGVLRQFNKFV
jgi:hypothetical protein